MSADTFAVGFMDQGMGHGHWRVLWADTMQPVTALYDEQTAFKMANARELYVALHAALEWIDAVPREAALPAMPGFDRDWVDTVLAKARGEAK